MLLGFYFDKLGYNDIPQTIKKYFSVPSLLRLKKVDYFCGMHYASKDVYNFKEYISRYDHSLTVCLLTYKLTKNIKAALAGLFHDIATPCFSHVIDYMNGDYEKQESTEEYTENILKNDEYLINLLKEDNIDINEIINFKKYTVVDNDRPKLCADRLDGIILTGIAWTKNIGKEDIDNIVDDITIFENEDLEKEIGFKTIEIAKKVVNVSNSIDIFCHSKEDNYMMDLLSKITKLAIDKNYISYDDLYYYDEENLFNILKRKADEELANFIKTFETIKKEDIPNISLPNVKIRNLNPLVNKSRL